MFAYPLRRHGAQFMNLRCAWCNTVYGTKEGKVLRTSHGACPACIRRFLEKLKKHDAERAANSKEPRPK